MYLQIDATTFTPKDGIVQLCNTSTAVIRSRKCVLVGNTTRLFVSRFRKKPMKLFSFKDSFVNI